MASSYGPSHALLEGVALALEEQIAQEKVSNEDAHQGDNHGTAGMHSRLFSSH